MPRVANAAALTIQNAFRVNLARKHLSTLRSIHEQTKRQQQYNNAIKRIGTKIHPSSTILNRIFLVVAFVALALGVTTSPKSITATPRLEVSVSTVLDTESGQVVISPTSTSSVKNEVESSRKNNSHRTKRVRSFGAALYPPLHEYGDLHDYL